MLEFIQNNVEALNNTHPIIRFCTYLSLIFILMIIILLIYLKNLRDRLRIKGRIETTYLKKYEADLIEYLYAGDNENTSEQQQKIVDYLKI